MSDASIFLPELLPGRGVNFLDGYEYIEGTLWVFCNGDFVDAPGRSRAYVVRFENVLIFRMTELDTWLRLMADDNDAWPDKCNAYRIDNSPLLPLVRPDVTNCKHYCLHTYDFVFDVVCENVSHEFQSPDSSAEPTPH